MPSDYQRGYDAGRSGSRRSIPISSHEEWLGYLAGKADLDTAASQAPVTGGTASYDGDAHPPAIRDSVRIASGLGAVAGAGVGLLATRSIPGTVVGVFIGGLAGGVLVAAEHAAVLAVTWPFRKLRGLFRS